jgi:hypothetical protein
MFGSVEHYTRAQKSNSIWLGISFILMLFESTIIFQITVYNAIKSSKISDNVTMMWISRVSLNVEAKSQL